jgi:endonuclease YncB( thermonuclease family)
MERTWRLPFLITRWVDGDTCHGTVDMGWGHLWTPPKGLRLLHADGSKYDAPERKGATLAFANQARTWAAVLAPAGGTYMVTSHYVDPDDFGRILCSIETAAGQDLAAEMVKAGYVK